VTGTEKVHVDTLQSHPTHEINTRITPPQRTRPPAPAPPLPAPPPFPRRAPWRCPPPSRPAPPRRSRAASRPATARRPRLTGQRWGRGAPGTPGRWGTTQSNTRPCPQSRRRPSGAFFFSLFWRGGVGGCCAAVKCYSAGMVLGRLNVSSNQLQPILIEFQPNKYNYLKTPQPRRRGPPGRPGRRRRRRCRRAGRRPRRPRRRRRQRQRRQRRRRRRRRRRRAGRPRGNLLPGGGRDLPAMRQAAV
jgi:hypothetical protein